MPPISRFHRHAAATLAAACAGTLALAAPASATQRFASASSADVVGSCTSLAPCRLDHAVNDAASGDEVIVEPGSYAVTYAVSAPVSVAVHGAWGQDRPHLVGSGGLAGSVLSIAAGGSASYLQVENNNPSADGVGLDGAIGSGLIVTSPAGLGATLKGAGILRDSVVFVRGANPAVEMKDSQAGGTAKLIGTTIAAPNGGAAAIKAKQGAGTATIRDSIVRGGANDVLLYAKASVAIDHSNLRPGASSPFADGGGNSSADPQFAGAAQGDFHLTASSPAIDTGTASDPDLGSTDADGAQRSFGAAPDMGAYEFGAPAGTWANPTGNAGGAGDSGQRLAPPAKPVAGSKVNVGPVKGHVRVRVPGSSGFVALGNDASVPVNSTIDATRGVVELTSARGANDGRSQTGRFWGGSFRVVQRTRGDGYTELVLSGGSFTGCRAPGRAKAAVAPRKRTVRRLWGQDHHGHFRSRGRRGDATVRGTRWLTEDRCDGTLFKVSRGAISVKAKGARRAVLLRAGQRYLARSR